MAAQAVSNDKPADDEEDLHADPTGLVGPQDPQRRQPADRLAQGTVQIEVVQDDAQRGQTAQGVNKAEPRRAIARLSDSSPGGQVSTCSSAARVGQSRFCSEDFAKLGQSPAFFRQAVSHCGQDQSVGKDRRSRPPAAAPAACGRWASKRGDDSIGQGTPGIRAIIAEVPAISSRSAPCPTGRHGRADRRASNGSVAGCQDAPNYRRRPGSWQFLPRAREPAAAQLRLLRLGWLMPSRDSQPARRHRRGVAEATEWQFRA